MFLLIFVWFVFPVTMSGTNQLETHPDSSTNICIEDCYIRNGDDIVVIN
jgi:hypothetical protein